MKKGLLLSGIIVWTLIVLVLLTLIAFIIGRGNNTIVSNTATASLVKQETVSLTDIENFVVKTSSTTIEIVKTNGTEARISQYGSVGNASEQEFTLDRNGGTVEVNIPPNHQLFTISVSRSRLVVELPAQYTKNLDATTSSGNIRVKDSFTLQDVSLDCSSGNIHIERELAADSLTMHTSSGRMVVNDSLRVKGEIRLKGSSGSVKMDGPVQAHSLVVKISSGTITLGKTLTETFDLESNSGTIRVSGITGRGSAESSSGNVYVTLDSPFQDVELRTNSGSIHITVDASASFKFTGLCSSGNIRANFPLEKNDKGNRATGSVGGNPTALISARSGSGNIVINQG